MSDIAAYPSARETVEHQSRFLSQLHQAIDGLVQDQYITEDQAARSHQIAKEAFNRLTNVGAEHPAAPESVWAGEVETVDYCAGQIHESYRAFYSAWEELTSEIISALRERHPGSDTQTIDLTAYDFHQLKEELPFWWERNQNSARNFLIIFQTFGEIVQNTYPSAQELINDQDMLFEMNSILFQTWSEENGELAERGIAINPLFRNRDYENFAAIAENGTPTEGWPAFLVHYFAYILDNPTYQQALEHADENNDGILQHAELVKLQQAFPNGQFDPARIHGLYQALQLLDSNDNNVVDQDEIDALESLAQNNDPEAAQMMLKVIDAVRDQAAMELYKDAYILRHLLAEVAPELFGIDTL